MRIPTASAILYVTNPEKHPIIDERCIQSLNDLGIIQWERITKSNQLKYLKVVRVFGEKYNKTVRGGEKGLFAYNQIKLDKYYLILYKINDQII